MDKRIIIFIVLANLCSGGFLAYRKLYYKHDGIQYAINPKMMIKTNDSISFEDHTADAGRWIWDFGDGEFSAASSGKHSYLHPGHYRVKVAAYGSFGMVSDSSKIVDVMPSDQYSMTHADVAVTPAGGIAGPASPQTGNASNYESTTVADAYEWSVEGDVTLAGRTQKGKVATYAFSKPGRKTLILTMRHPDAVVKKEINVAEGIGHVAGENPLPPPPVVPAGAYTGPAVVKKQPHEDPKPAAKTQQQPHTEKSKPALKDVGDGVEY